MGRSPSKITEEGKTVDTDRKEKERRRKEKVVLPTGGGEATNTEKIEDLYASVQSWGSEQEGNLPFPSWKGVDEYQYPVDLTSLSANFVAVIPPCSSPAYET